MKFHNSKLEDVINKYESGGIIDENLKEIKQNQKLYSLALIISNFKNGLHK